MYIFTIIVCLLETIPPLLNMFVFVEPPSKYASKVEMHNMNIKYAYWIVVILIGL